MSLIRKPKYQTHTRIFPKGVVQYTIAAIFLYSIPAQPAVYWKLSLIASEIFMIIIKILVNHFYDFHKIFSRGWVGSKKVAIQEK